MLFVQVKAFLSFETSNTVLSFAITKPGDIVEYFFAMVIESLLQRLILFLYIPFRLSNSWYRIHGKQLNIRLNSLLYLALIMNE